MYIIVLLPWKQAVMQMELVFQVPLLPRVWRELCIIFSFFFVFLLPMWELNQGSDLAYDPKLRSVTDGRAS